MQAQSTRGVVPRAHYPDAPSSNGPGANPPNLSAIEHIAERIDACTSGLHAINLELSVMGNRVLGEDSNRDAAGAPGSPEGIGSLAAVHNLIDRLETAIGTLHSSARRVLHL